LNLPSTSLQDQAAASAAFFYGFETGFFQDAGFLKLRELSLTYLAPPAWASRIGASSVSLTLSVVTSRRGPSTRARTPR